MPGDDGLGFGRVWRTLAIVDAQTDDSVLMSRYRQGEVAAFDTLYARHKGPLYRYLLRQCRAADAAADIFQEIWSRVISTRERYEVRAAFRTYLYRIAHHCLIDYYRLRDRKRADRMEALEDHSETLMGASHEQPEVQAYQEQFEDSFQQALAGLPDEQRAVFLLFEESGLGLKEIAEVTGVPAETVKSRLRYAVAKLRRGLAGEFAPPGFSAVRMLT